MRVFLVACLAIIVLALGSYVAVSAAQKASGTAYTTEGARIKQSWSYRRVAKRAGPTTPGMKTPDSQVEASDDCEVGSTWRWITIDFGGDEDAACS